jgi:enediyne biosynthesis thioesterase
MRSYDYKHVIALEETNLVGNVYFVNHLRWQGRCREMFLRDRAPSVLEALHEGLALVTTHCSCDYLEELKAFDEVTICMTLRPLMQSRLVLNFEYRRGDTVVARGTQQITCVQRRDSAVSAAPIPAALCDALKEYL